MPSKIVKICAILIAITVIAICGFNFDGGGDYKNITSDYNKTTQNHSRTTVSSVISAINNEQITPGVTSNTNTTMIDTSSWLSIADGVHKQWGAAGFTYGYGQYSTFTQSDGSQISVRRDCSGYVGYCLYVAGKASTPSPITSGSDLSKYGFKKVDKPYGYSMLKPGDVVAWSGSHIQIYVGASPDDVWLNWGGVQSTSDKYAGITDVSKVISTSSTASNHQPDNADYVWRP